MAGIRTRQRVTGDRVEDVPAKELDRQPGAVRIGGKLVSPAHEFAGYGSTDLIPQPETSPTSGTGASLTVEEADGTPSVAEVDTIIFPNGLVTDNEDGSVTIAGGNVVAATAESFVLTLDKYSAIGAWTNLDLSAFVPEGAQAAFLFVTLTGYPVSSVLNAIFRLAADGETGDVSRLFDVQIITPNSASPAHATNNSLVLVKLNASRICKYYWTFGGATPVALNLYVKLAGYL